MEIKEKTALEWLNTIENTQIRAKAVENWQKQHKNLPQTLKESLVDAIQTAFVWDETPEGVEYWGEFRDSVK